MRLAFFRANGSQSIPSKEPKREIGQMRRDHNASSDFVTVLQLRFERGQFLDFNIRKNTQDQERRSGNCKKFRDHRMLFSDFHGRIETASRICASATQNLRSSRVLFYHRSADRTCRNRFIEIPGVEIYCRKILSRKAEALDAFHSEEFCLADRIITAAIKIPIRKISFKGLNAVPA